MQNPPFLLSDEVAEALDAGRPVVALESTIISHGLPRPRNLEAARGFEALLRDAGVVPATIAVLDGVPRIGLDDEGVGRIANEDMAKASIRDLPIIAARGASAATTVAATTHLAALAGGNLFVLGNTFANTADRLVSYGVSKGLRRYLIVHEKDVAGQLGEAAIEGAIARNRATMVGKTAHGETRAEMDAIAPTIAAAAAANKAQALFLTGNHQDTLPEITAALARAGVTSQSLQMMGLTRWDLPASRTGLPQLQNGWFAVPDLARMAEFNARYKAAFGETPHDFATLAYDGVSAIAANIRAGRKNAVTTAGLTQGAGYAGVQGAFRLRPDGTNQRQLSIATLQGGRMVVIDPARRSFGGIGF